MSHVTRHAKKVQETTLSAAEMLQRAVDAGRLPTKRFRVEGTAVGSSHLLSDLQADRAAGRYRGQKVEVITREMFLTAQAAALPTCTQKGCGARAGQACRNLSGLRTPHAVRLGFRETPTSAAEGFAACPFCLAPAGKACQTARGRGRMPHKERPTTASLPAADELTLSPESP